MGACMNQKNRFSIEVSFVFIWWTSLLISGFTYWGGLTQIRLSSICTSGNVVDFLALISNPKYWFAIFTFALTVFGGYHLFKKLASSRSYLEDFRHVILAVFIMLILLLPVIGCR